MKRNDKFLEAKQSENAVYLFRFGWKRKIRNEMKRKKKKNFSRERAKRISFRFVSLWSEKILEAKPAHPTPKDIQLWRRGDGVQPSRGVAEQTKFSRTSAGSPTSQTM